MKRSEQKIQDTWKMEDMFISDEAWEKDFEKATKMIPHYSDFSGEVSKDKEKLIEYFNFNDEMYIQTKSTIRIWQRQSIRHIQERHRN
mgnify:CR=1 FL=1